MLHAAERMLDDDAAFRLLPILLLLGVGQSCRGIAFRYSRLLVRQTNIRSRCVVAFRSEKTEIHVQHGTAKPGDAGVKTGFHHGIIVNRAVEDRAKKENATTRIDDRQRLEGVAFFFRYNALSGHRCRPDGHRQPRSHRRAVRRISR